MPQETLGYIRLEWTCPNCGVKNPGPQKTCSGCGAPQPADVSFTQTEHQELVQDAAEVEKAKVGPDIHCGFCGARNPSGTAICVQCGADLKEGKARISGQVVGAYQSGPAGQVNCPSCGSPNPETAMRCANCGASLAKTTTPPVAAPAKVETPAKKNWLWGCLAVAAILLVCVVGYFIVSSLRTEGMTGKVDRVAWTRVVAIEALGPVTKQDWKSEIPAGAQLGDCKKEYHHTQNEPADDAEKICGTPYTVDQGSGYGKVVQDCEYKVYQDYCDYTVNEWKQMTEYKLSGSDLNPAWPAPKVSGSDQRLGDRSETYTVVFDTDKGQMTYTTSDADLFARCEPGSRWTLNVNTFNQVLSIEPVK